MTDTQRAKILTKLLDAPPGLLTAREIIHLKDYDEMNKLQMNMQFEDNWLLEMDRKILPEQRIVNG